MTGGVDPQCNVHQNAMRRGIAKSWLTHLRQLINGRS